MTTVSMMHGRYLPSQSAKGPESCVEFPNSCQAHSFVWMGHAHVNIRTKIDRGNREIKSIKVVQKIFFLQCMAWGTQKRFLRISKQAFDRQYLVIVVPQ